MNYFKPSKALFLLIFIIPFVVSFGQEEEESQDGAGGDAGGDTGGTAAETAVTGSASQPTTAASGATRESLWWPSARVRFRHRRADFGS